MTPGQIRYPEIVEPLRGQVLVFNGEAFGRLVVLQSLFQHFLVLIQRAYNVAPTNVEQRAGEKLVQGLSA